MNPPGWCTRSLLRLQFAADGITDDWILRSRAAYWPIRRAGRRHLRKRWCGAMASPGVRNRSGEPPAIRLGGLNPMRNGEARHRARRRSRTGRPLHGACAASHSYTCTGVFSYSLLGMMRSQRSSPLSRCGMNLLRMSSDLGGGRRAAAAQVLRARFAVARLQVSIAALPRRVTSSSACRILPPPDPFMEQLHVATSVVGGQASREIATPALPQRLLRRTGVPHPDRQVSGSPRRRRCRPTSPCSGARRARANLPDDRDACDRRQVDRERRPRFTARECADRGTAAVCRSGASCGA
jgi:hypothetical protein